MKIICGGAKTGKTEYVYNSVIKGIDEGRKQLIIVPETTSHQTEKAFLKKCGNSSSTFGKVSTFTKLCQEVFDAVNVAKPFISDGGRILIMYKALEQVQSSLKYYGSAMSKPQLVTSLLSMTDELKACAISAEQMLEAALSADMSEKIGDIGKIYAAYCGICDKYGLDGKDKLTVAAENVKKTSMFCETDVYIDGFFGFTKQEYKFLQEMLRQANSLSLTILFGEDEQLYMEQHRTIGRLKRLSEAEGDTCQIVKVENQYQRPDEIDYICRGLFDYKVKSFENECKAIKLYSAANLSQECELVAGIVRNAVLDTDIRYREINLVCGDETEYVDKLESVFLKYDIPFYVSKKQDVLKKIPVIAAIEPLKAIYYGMSIDSVMAYIKTGLCGIDDDSREKLENYAFTWNINGKKWFEQWTLPVGGYNRIVENCPQLAQLNELRKTLMEPIVQLKNDISQCKCGADFALTMKNHLQRCMFQEKIEQRISRLEENGNLRTAAEYAQLFEIITQAIEQFELICNSEKMDLGTFLQLFTLMLSQYDVGTIPVMLDSVIMGNFDRITPEKVKLLIVLGARDGLLPPVPPQASILLESERIALEGVNVELTQSQEGRAFEGYSKLVQTISSVEEKLIFTYPTALDDGSECADSYLIKRISTLLPQLKAENADDLVDKFALTARAPAFEHACMGAGRKNTMEANYAAYTYFAKDTVKQKYFTDLNKYSVSPRGPIKKYLVVKGLYGDTINLSASRVEKASACRFSYFMQYGLKAKSRKRATFGAPEVGTLVHYVVENTIRDLDENSEQAIAKVAKKHIDAYILTNLGGNEDKSARFKGLMRNITKYVINIVINIYEELKCSDFRPLCFEMSFGNDGDVAAMSKKFGTVTMSYNGKIDRVDGYIEGERLYIKVVDYKTGNKSFKLSDVYNGLNMQMFLYMLMLKERAPDFLAAVAKEKLGKQAVDIEMAAALYIPAKSPYIAAESADNQEYLQAKRNKELRRIGIINSDPVVLNALEHAENGMFRFLPVDLKVDGSLKATSQVASAQQLGRLMKKVENNLNQLAQAICTGDIEANPAKADKGKSICAWCEYKSACHFDESMERDVCRELSNKTDAEVHKILEEEECNGN